MDLPRNFLVFSLSWFQAQGQVVHIIDIPSRLHVCNDIILKLRNRLQRIRYGLILLNLSDNIGGLHAFVEIDQSLIPLNEILISVRNKSKILQINT